MDLAAQRTITDDWIASVSGWTPYHGQAVTGWPIATVVRGQAVVCDEALVGRPLGAPMAFLETP